jgi:polyphosphate kinase
VADDPYESFEPVVDLIEAAAEDPGVIAIKQTLYRTSSDSPIIKALAKAAQNGKEVIVLVELKARFDEAQNVNWAKQLEDAGCHVIYGIANLKTHAKALLIVRREETRIRRYVHLATGNYNDKTAKLYSDIGLLTCDHAIALDVTAFFNLLTGLSETVGWQELAIAPADMKQKFLDLIEREIQVSSADKPGFIMAKVNSLQDKVICKALYRASQAGVKVLLNVRGICCLRPGLNGVSDHIEVCSIVDRYLEHARIFYFRNGGHDEVYLSSADWMRRNLDRRLELLFPVKDGRLKKRLIDILNVYFTDNTQSEILNSDGNYTPKVKKGKKIRAQEHFYNVACEAVRNSRQSSLRYRPMKSRP